MSKPDDVEDSRVTVNLNDLQKYVDHLHDRAGIIRVDWGNRNERIERLRRLLEPMPWLAAWFPAFAGSWAGGLVVTLMMVVVDQPLPVWRWVGQALFVGTSTAFAVLSWRARRQWKARS